MRGPLRTRLLSRSVLLCAALLVVPALPEACAGTGTVPDRRTAAAEASVPSEPADSLAALIEAAGDSLAYPDAGQVTVFDRTEVRVEESGLSRVRRRVLTKVLRESGACALATLRFDYDPASNDIRVERVRVRRAGGRLEEVDPGRAVDLPAPADMIYWGARMKLLALPRLEVGDAVEVETVKKGFQIAYLAGEEAPPNTGTSAAADTSEARYVPPMRGHFYDVVTFQDAVPIREKTYRLYTRKDKPVQFAVYNGSLASSLRFTDSLLVYEWSARNVAAMKAEPRTPDLTDLAPKVVLATVESWPEKSRWFFDVNDPVFAADERIQRKVDELTRGLRTDDEKMAVLLHWVAQEIRYSGLSMGKGEGYTLHPGTMTYEDRCGVCKDIAGMLVTMLRAAGFPANPVMTMAGSRVEAVPADQFNHCVVAVRRPDGSTTMLDPTWAPFSRDIWSRMEGEQNYVVGSAQGEGLSRIRTFTPEENAITLDGHSRIAADGSLTGEIRLTGIGASDSRIRGILAEAPAGERNRTLAELLSALGPAVEVDGFDTVEPRDFSRDASLAIRYRVPRYASAGDSVLAFVPPVTRFAAHTLRICRLLSFEKPAEERTQDALLWFSQALVAKEVVDLPAGFRWTGGADTVRVERDAGSVRARCEARKGSVAVDIRAVSALRTVPAAAWAGGAEAADSLRAFGSRVRVAGRAR